MVKKRLVWADSLKGGLIVLVVLGHSLQQVLGEGCYTNHLWNIIYSFHMPAFMAISGFLAYKPNPSWEGLSGCFSKIYKRFQQLMIPFFIWSLFVLLITNDFSFSNVIGKILYPDRGFWFLWVLFFINVIFILGDWFARKTNIKQEIIEISLCLLLAGVMLLMDIRVFGFQFVSYYFVFYILGHYLHKYNDRLITNSRIAIILLSVIWFVLAWFWSIDGSPSFLGNVPLPHSYMNYFYRFITAAIAAYVLVAMAPEILNGEERVNKVFVNLGSTSLGIYTTHMILLGWIVVLFKGLELDDKIVVVFSFIIGLLLSWLTVFLLRKWKFTSKWLLGKL